MREGRCVGCNGVDRGREKSNVAFFEFVLPVVSGIYVMKR